MKTSPLLISLVLALCAERTEAQVLIYNVFGTPTAGNIIFNDTASGGTSTTVTSGIPALPLDLPMNNIGWMTYTSTGFPHVDSGSMTVDINQAPGGPGSIPWFSATGSLAQAGAVTGDTAFLTSNVSAGFEGFMTPVNPASLTPLLGYLVSGIVGTNPGAFASFTAQLDYYDSSLIIPVLVGSLNWSFSTTTPGPFATPVYPTWVGAPTLGSNLIDVSGFIQLSADPSSISITPVPEPAAMASLLLGTVALASRRRREK